MSDEHEDFKLELKTPKEGDRIKFNDGTYSGEAVVRRVFAGGLSISAALDPSTIVGPARAWVKNPNGDIMYHLVRGEFEIFGRGTWSFG